MYQVGEPVESVRKIRDAIDYPIIDADAHVIEARFALHDFVKQIYVQERCRTACADEPRFLQGNCRRRRRPEARR